MTIIQQPSTISLSGNMLPFIINLGSLVNFTLKDGPDVLIEATYEPDTTGTITIDIKDIVESRLKYNIKGDAFYEQTEIVKQFTATIDATNISFKVIRCGVLDLADTPTNWLTGNFLTWQPQNKAVTYHSPEWLTYYATQACTIKLKAYFPGEAEQNLITLGSCQAGKAFTFNLQFAHIAGLLGSKYPTHYDLWAEKTTGERLSFIQRYYFSEVKSDQENWFGFENSLGGLDFIRASGDGDLSNDSTHNLAIVDGEVQEYKIDTKRIYTKNTGHLTDYERRWLLDFPSARKKYIYHNGSLRQIAVTETNFRYSVSDSPTDYTFKYRFINQSSCLNLTRSEHLIPLSITVPDIDAPGFFLPPRLAEFPRVILSEGTIIPAFDPYSDKATTTTVGALIGKAVEETVSAVPGHSEGGTLVQVIGEDSVLPATDKNVFSGLRSIKEIGTRISNALDGFSTSLKSKFLSKTEEDSAQKLITFLSGLKSDELSQFIKGFTVGNYTPGLLDGSGGVFRMKDGKSHLEVDNLDVRQAATFYEAMIMHAKHVGGELINSAANMICTNVDDAGSYWRCYFNAGENNEVPNTFVAGDQARCQIFLGTKQKFYWRLVLGIGVDYIDLSKTEMAAGSDAPEIGDNIFQLGNPVDKTRQSAQIISSVGENSPSFIQYGGINSFSLAGCMRNAIIGDGTNNRLYGKVTFVGADNQETDLEDFANQTMQNLIDAHAAANEADRKAQQAIQDAQDAVADYNAKIEGVQDQLDGKVNNWYYPYKPTLSNYPASEWTTNALKDIHIGDTFTNIEEIPAENAGKSWRFVKDGATYKWTEMSNSDAIKALQKASEAQATADGKSATFFVEPYGYDVGDSWILSTARKVNGIDYKAGELLQSSNKSEIFNQAHWSKRLRYTDDTAVENLEIGGRNYVQLNKLGSYAPYNTTPILIGGSTFETSRVGSDTLTISASYVPVKGFRTTSGFIKINGVIPTSDPFVGSRANTQNSGGVKKYDATTGYFEFTEYTESGSNKHWILHVPVIWEIGNTVTIDKLKLGKGTKATDWSPAPEDVDASIAAAKKAGTDAQTAANTANTAVGQLETTVNTTFKNGIINNAEAISIKEQIRVVETGRDNVINTYNVLYISAYLSGTPKTSLLNTKVTFEGAVSDLIGAINTATADGSITTPERNNVNSKFTDYRNAFKSFQTAIANAQKAIDAELKRLADVGIGEAKNEANTALSKANQAAAVTDKFATTVDGGLISTVMMLLRELNSQTETAGISGIQGALRNNPAFWAGGKYSEALALIQFLSKMSAGTAPASGEYAGLAKITMLHNGAAKIGDFIIEESGRIVMVDPATGVLRLVFSTENLPIINILMAGTSSTGSINIGSGSTSTTETLSGTANVTISGGMATIGAMNITVSASGRKQLDGRSSFVSVNLVLYRDNVKVRAVWGSNIFFTNDSNQLESETRQFQATSISLSAKGSYHFKLEVERDGDITSAFGSSTAFTLDWNVTLQGIKRQQYGLDGMMFYYSNNHFHYTESEGLDLRGKTNMPGVLASGTVSTSGGLTNEWGAKVNYGQPITGGYRIFLKNMTHNQYSVQVTPHTATTFRVSTKTTGYFDILGTGAADFVVFGRNY